MRILILLAIACCLHSSQIAFAQSAAFTYQGRIELDGGPVNEPTDFIFYLYNSLTSATPVAGPNTRLNTPVLNGHFTVLLNFGSTFDGSTRYLEIRARPNGSSDEYSILAPRQLISSVPYAIRAANVYGTNISGPILIDFGSASAPAYSFPFNSSTGMFGPGSNQLGFSVAGNEAMRISSAGRVGVGVTENLDYRFIVGAANHQIVLHDTDNSKRWSLTTVSNTGFGVYEDASTARLVINSGGRATLTGGKAIVTSVNSTELQMHRFMIGLGAINIAPNQFLETDFQWGNLGFSSPPSVFIGNFIAGASGTQDYDHFRVTTHAVTTIGCKFRITNVSSVTATTSNGAWSVMIVGPK